MRVDRSVALAVVRRVLPGVVAVSAVLLAALAGVSTPAQPRPREALAAEKGPYLQNGDRTSMVVMWETKEAGDSVVEYGRTKDLGQTARGENGTTHEVAIAELSPATTYYYRAVTGGAASDVRSFTTAPDRGANLTFCAYGDSRSNPLIHQRLARLMSAERPDFVLNAGDLVKDGRNADEWTPQFFRPLRELMDHVPLFPVLGNHENNSRFYYSLFSLPVDSPGRERYYVLRWSNALFVNLDSNLPLLASAPQMQWAAKALAASTEEWKFLHFHHPPWSSGGSRTSRPVREAIHALATAHGVDVVLTGHDHQYERNTVDGVEYFVVGGGGAGLDEIKQREGDATFRLFVKEYSYARFEIAGRRLTCQVKSVKDEVIERLTIDKSGGQVKKTEALGTVRDARLLACNLPRDGDHGAGGGDEGF
ncbi:MAG: metallophosphoesterase family protein [Planctomycetes bacterium]|nr:metallophosphoesterase family protein [Planctomycetota bacterium]